jgi:hypothetical protein
MSIELLIKRALRIVAIPFALYLVLVGLVYFRQRSLIFFPTHGQPSMRLKPWLDGKRTIGFCREVSNPQTVWLMTHGNGGQASDRDYVLNRLSDQDSLYVLEYPGYGQREGNPCLQSINQAASEAYHILRSRYPKTPACVLGESIGSGPACSLAREKIPPDKIVLVVPFDSLANIASRRFYFLPVRFMLRDAWDNVEALAHYAGSVDIFGATGDTIIPIDHAKALARQVRGARFIPIAGEHNDWSANNEVRITR